MAITVRLYRNYYPGTSPSFSRYYESLEEATKAGKEKLVKLNQYECWIYEYHFTGLMTKAFISALLNKGEPAKRILIKKILFEKAAPKPAPKSPEEILGVSKSANKADIKMAFRTKAKSMHPDVGGSHEDFVALNSAFEWMMERAAA